MHSKTFSTALVTALVLTGFAGTASAGVTDSSYYNTGGPGLTNSTVPAPKEAFGGHGEPALTLKPGWGRATAAVDASVYNTSSVGALAGLNPTGAPATGYGEMVRDSAPNPRLLAATEPVDAGTYNTSGPGAIAGQNPGLRLSQTPRVRLAAR